MPITKKDKAIMLDRLAMIYNNALDPSFTLNPSTFCLAVIAICILENHPAAEDATHQCEKEPINQNSH